MAESSTQPLALVVEDDVDNRELIAEALVMSGFRVAEAADGLEAVERARELAPDVILMDLSLPEIDGLEATRRIKEDAHTSKIPIVMLTGSRPSEVADEAPASRPDGVLMKPPLLEEILAELHRVLGR